MKLYKKVIPYLIFGSAAVFNSNTANAQKAPTAEPNTSQPTTESRLIARAENTRDLYVENMLAAQKRLNPQIGTRNYRSAVRQELPGAPVGLHCMYGQYTQLKRALNENGDTLTIIPQKGKNACIAFKSNMRKKYSAPEYTGTIKEGRALASDSVYNAELAKYLKQRKITDSTDPKRRDAAIAEFAAHNFSLEHVNPGSIMIVPRFRGSKNKFHAIMFLGEGRIESGEFAPDTTGNYMFTAHNNERIGDLIKSWDMSNVFCADIEKILEVEYTKELSRLESMPREKMLTYLSDGSALSVHKLQSLRQDSLAHLVQAKYFGDDVKALYSSLQLQQWAKNIPNETLLQVCRALTR